MMYLIVALFLVLDFITGLIKSFKNKTFTSQIMREGLFHKCGSIMCIMFGVLVDFAQRYFDLGVTVPVAVAISTYIILMECGSIIENLGTINPQIVPLKVKNYFEKLKN